MSANKERIQLWVDALESGEFMQTRNRLQDFRGYCCMGVACEVYRRATNDGTWEKRVDEPYYHFNENIGILPEKVCDWFGLDNANPRLYGPESVGLTTAAAANDAFGMSFREIAGIVRRTFLT